MPRSSGSRYPACRASSPVSRHTSTTTDNLNSKIHCYSTETIDTRKHSVLPALGYLGRYIHYPQLPSPPRYPTLPRYLTLLDTLLIPRRNMGPEIPYLAHSPQVGRMTHSCEKITSPQLRWRVVNIYWVKNVLQAGHGCSLL